MRATVLFPLLLGCGENLLTYGKDAEAPTILVSPTSLSFDVAGSQTVTVASTGDVPLNVSSVALRSGGAFTLTNTGALPGELASGEAVELVITWAPEGEETADWLDIVSDDPTAPLVPVVLEGAADGLDTGDSAEDSAEPMAGATLDPAEATLEAVVGDTVTAAFTVQNTGETVLTVNASVAGNGFVLTAPTTWPATVEVGAALVLGVSFTPDSTGAFAGQLDVAVVDLPALSATLSGTGLGSGGDTLPATYTWTGAAQTFTVPAGVHSLTVEAWGAGGGAGSYSGAYAGAGGGGAYATTVLSVSPGDEVTIRPGEGGHQPGGGGGASLVWDAAGSLVVVAGAGGGGGTDGGSLLSGSGAGGAGGAGTGVAGSMQFDSYWGSASGGQGGTATAGGAGGVGALGAASGPACTGGAGALQVGGGGATGSSSCTVSTAANADVAGVASSNGAGGGGGSGWYGGGGGGSVYTYFGGGGGGGSSSCPSGTVWAGSGRTPGGTSSAMWDGAAGAGGTPGVWPATPATDGAPGMVVLQR